MGRGGARAAKRDAERGRPTDRSEREPGQARTHPGSPTSARVIPRKGSADPPTRCDLCGNPMRESHCKLICDACGYTRDCSDP